LVVAAVEAIAQAKPTPDAVIDGWLTGKLNLNRIALDLPLASEQLGALAGVFAASLDPTLLNLGEGGGHATSEGQGVARDVLERQAIRALLENEPVWSLEAERDSFSELFYDLKEAVRLGRASEEIAQQIATSPLVNAVRLAGSTAPSSSSAPAAPADTEQVP
jgi:hypothetical protein